MFETQFVFLLFFNKTRGNEDRFSHVGRVSDIFFFFFFLAALMLVLSPYVLSKENMQGNLWI
jgi:hypothetical protein